jgi:hypothetical protein
MNDSKKVGADSVLGSASGGVSRREVLAGSAALLLGESLRARAAESGPAVLASDKFFLSAENPIANVDQRDLEALAIQIFARPDVQAAKKRAAATWALVTDQITSPEQWTLFESAVSDYCFASILYAVSSDANYPKVLRVESPGATWMGNVVPASKWGGDNPDNAYRMIAVDSTGRYEVRGQRQKNPPAIISYQLLDNLSSGLTYGTLAQRDMEISPDGSFVITLDDSPPNGRKNHLQIPPGAMYVHSRDSMSDWMQTPDSLRVRRLNPPSRPPLSIDELAARAIRNILSNIYFAYYALRVTLNLPPQSMSAPGIMTATSALPTQTACYGSFKLRDDEAVVITKTGAMAKFHNIVLHDMWNRALEYRDHQSHLNNSQMAADADGHFTFVVSLRDPGVHNWLDTQGTHEVIVGCRWQGIPPTSGEKPGVEYRVVKFAELHRELHSGVKRVTALERAAQLHSRQTGFDRRFLDS